jgi:hypothetical protein
MTFRFIPKSIETALWLVCGLVLVAIGIWLMLTIIEITSKVLSKSFYWARSWVGGTFGDRFDWEFISIIGFGVVFLLIKNDIKTALVLLSIMLSIIICVAIEIWLMFTIFKLIAWILIESMVWTRFWVRANFDDDLRSVADHRLDWLFSGLLGFALSPLWPVLLPVSYLLKIAAIPKFRESRQLSGDFNLPADRLETLAYHWDRQTRQNVASNPNTPANILIYLLPEFPRSVAENPTLALLRFADLGFMESIPEDDLIKILADREASPLWIEASIRRRTPKLTAALLERPQLPAETIEQILDAIDEFLVADLLFKHRHCNHRIRLIIATSPDLQNLKYALIPHLRRSPRSRQLLELIAATGNQAVHLQLLQARHCPPSIGTQILHQSPNKLTRKLVDRHGYDVLPRWLRQWILHYASGDSKKRVHLRKYLFRSRRIGLSTKLNWLKSHPRIGPSANEYPKLLLVWMAIELMQCYSWPEVWRCLWVDRQRFLHIWKITVCERGLFKLSL